MVVGASAGGLEAFKRLLSALPARTGMAFVLIPHLDPGRESRMVELLAGSSGLPVAQAREGQQLRRDRVYVIPPNRLLTFRRGRLALTRLRDSRAAHTALDVALCSLAEDQGPSAIGIVMSGTGNHGASGLKSVLSAGGLALVQDPATARYDQMPRSALALGVSPENALAPERMPAVLLARAARLARLPGDGRTAPLAIGGAFFRNPGALDYLASRVLPRLVAGASGQAPVRVWVPECGTGEEAYSVAILLLERFEAAARPPVLKIFATDADPRALEIARRGVYPESAALGLAPQRRARFFLPGSDGRYQVSSALRETLVFGRHEFLIDPPISNLDLIVHRTPFGPGRREAHRKLIALLSFALKQGGYALLAHGSNGKTAGVLESLTRQWPLYRRNGDLPAPAHRTPAPHALRNGAGARAMPAPRARAAAAFVPRRAGSSKARPGASARGHGARSLRSGKMERGTSVGDLERARRDIEALNEEANSANQELRSYNELLQSMNEELQAANEELESSKTALEERTEEVERVEAQLRAVLDVTADAVVTVDARDRIVTFNQSAARMFGYALNEVIGQKLELLVPAERDWASGGIADAARASTARALIGTAREVSACRRSGQRFPALLSVSETADTELLVCSLRDLSLDKALQQEVLRIATLEQQRIGQELHDGVQQELTGLGLLAQNLSDALGTSALPDAALARRLAEGLAGANLHVRSLARGLVPVPVGAETLPAALAELAKSTGEAYRIACRFECPDPPRIPDAGTATHLYRIAQEAVGNAIKHARSRDIAIRLLHRDGRLRLEICDDGIGVPALSAGHAGVGLRLMEHRCTIVGGRFALESRPGGGTVVSCTIGPRTGS